jgi:hypothetical protein
MTPIGTAELVLLLVALGGMTAAATWAVIEQKSREDEWISQEVAERFYDLLAVGEGGRCLKSLTSR